MGFHGNHPGVGRFVGPVSYHRLPKPPEVFVDVISSKTFKDFKDTITKITSKDDDI